MNEGKFIEMPSITTQKAYLFSHWQEMELHFSLYMKDREMEDLHQMRIHIKKIHALILFIAYLNNSEKIIKNFIPVKKLFKKAGKIRELQIHFEKLKKDKKERSLLRKKIFRKIEKENFDFIKKRKKWTLIIQKTFPKIDSKISPCSDERLNRYLKFQMEEAYKDFKNGEFHETRKRIKLVLNLHELLSEKSKDTLRLNLSYLDDVQDKIGKWNDLTQSIKMMNIRKSPELRELKELTKDLIRSGENLKNSAYFI